MNWTLPEILGATGGELVRWGPGPFRGFSTDSRTLLPDEVFVALKGPRFDGQEFLSDALRRGASAAIASRDELCGSAALVHVDDGLRALGDLAAAYRRRLPVRVIGVTGSNGKTTTKEMIAAVLAASGACVAKSRGTENNLVGLPRTLLSLSGSEDFAVARDGHESPRRDLAIGRNRAPGCRRDHQRGTRTSRKPGVPGERRCGQGGARPCARPRTPPSSSTVPIRASRPSANAARVAPSSSATQVRAMASSPTASGQLLEVEVDGRHGRRSRSPCAAPTTYRTPCSRWPRRHRPRARPRGGARRAPPLRAAADAARDRRLAEWRPRSERRLQRQPRLDAGGAGCTGGGAGSPSYRRARGDVGAW